MNPRTAFSVALSLFFMTAAAHAQVGTRPTDFAGITWGAPLGEATKILKEREGVKLKEEKEDELAKSDPLTVTATGGKFGNWAVTTWTLTFVDGKFARGAVVLHAPGDDTKLYREIRQQLITKYGAPSSERQDLRPVRPPSRQPSIQSAQWYFPVKPEDKNRLSIALESTKTLTLRYSNETLAAVQPKAGKNGAPGVAKDL